MADQKHRPSDLPSHASPIISPLPRASSQFLHSLGWSDIDRSQTSTPGIPDNLISPAFTPPLTPSIPSTPSHHEHERRLDAEPKSIPVDTSLDDPGTTKQPKLMEKLPVVECVVRARIPTTSGAEMFLHLYQNDSDNKEHLAIVFGNTIRSRSLDAEKPGETEMDRMIRGAYVGRLRPGRVSSRSEEEQQKSSRSRPTSKQYSGSALKNVTTPEDVAPEGSSSASAPSAEQRESIDSTISSLSQSQGEQAADLPSITPKTTPVVDTHASRPPPPIEPPSPTHSDPDISQARTYKAPLIRIHSECYTGETAWSARCDCGEQLDEAARLMSLPSNTPHPGGVIVYLRQEGRGIGLASKLKAYNLQDLGNDTVEANLLLRHPADARSYGLATSILADLGLGTDADASKPESERGIRLLTNNPDKVRAVEGPGREVRVVERVAMVPLAWKSGGLKGVKGAEIEKYLETKIGRMGHMLAR